MNEERLRILKMLKEGRITMEEAELLLDALNEPGSQSSNAQDGPPPGGDARSQSRGRADEPWAKTAERFFGGFKGGKQFNFDLDSFQNGLQDAMKGFEQTMKQFAGDVGKMDFPAGFKEFFGRSSGQSTKSLLVTTSGAKRLAISNKWGDLRINGTDSDEISGTVSVTAWASDQQSAQEVAEAVEISHVREDDTIVLRGELPPEYRRTRYRVDFDLNLPSGMELAIKGMSGDVAVTGANAGLSVVNLSGDVIVQRSSGVIGIESKSGDVELLDCDGEVRAHTLSGDMNLEGVRAVLVQAHTVSGDIRAEVDPVEQGEIELQTTSGDVTLVVPETKGLNVQADTTSGEIRCKLPIEPSQQRTGHLAGTVGDGATSIRAQTKSGDITLQSERT